MGTTWSKKMMQIRQGETQKKQGAITREVCCLAAQFSEQILQCLTKAIIAMLWLSTLSETQYD